MLQKKETKDALRHKELFGDFLGFFVRLVFCLFLWEVDAKEGFYMQPLLDSEHT